MLRPKKKIQLHVNNDIYYVWVGGSCDYAHEERCGGAAYIIEKEGERQEEFVISDRNTTEFRMMLQVMIHAMSILPESSKICFLTNVAYLQNFDKAPSEKTANADLINLCITSKLRHAQCQVKLVPYYKFVQLSETHEMAHEAMLMLRNNKN